MENNHRVFFCVRTRVRPPSIFLNQGLARSDGSPAIPGTRSPFAPRGDAGRRPMTRDRETAGGQSPITEKPEPVPGIREFSIRVPPYHIWACGSRMFEIEHRTGTIL